jgi:hypothetical protein
MNTRVLLRLAAALLGFVAAGTACAHAVGVSRGEYTVAGERVAVDLAFARGELLRAVDGMDRDGDGRLAEDELGQGAMAIAAALTDGVVVARGGRRCALSYQGARLLDADGVALRADYDCASSSGPVEVRWPWLSRLSIGHRHLAAIGPGATPAVIYEAAPAFVIDAAAAAPRASGFFGLLWMGIEHILSGYDHLLFLFALVVLGGRIAAVVKVVTAFTIAHSITLGLAVFGVLAPSPALIEPLIALTIVYVAGENWFAKDIERRWRITFPFGLIHGFGFAGALQEIALPRSELPMALLAFNLGVEAGQLAVLAVLLPLVVLLRRRPGFDPHGVRVASVLVGAMGLVWFVERVAT